MFFINGTKANIDKHRLKSASAARKWPKPKLGPEDAPAVLEPIILTNNTLRSLLESQLSKFYASQMRFWSMKYYYYANCTIILIFNPITIIKFTI